MLAIFAEISILWLVACGLLLDMPVISNFTFNTLGFIFGALWALFASSWALLYIIAPDITSYASFCQTLKIQLCAAPVLQAFHFLFGTAIVCWYYFLFKGLVLRTSGNIRKIIEILAITVIILLALTIIYLLFGDVIQCE